MLIIIDNYDSFTYNLHHLVAQFTPDVQVIRHDRASVAAIIDMQPAAIILSPGPGRPEAAGICVELIQALPKCMPLLGVCLGLQAIVCAFSGQVVMAPDMVHGKASPVFHHEQGIYAGMALPFTGGRYHSLMADGASLPASLVIEAATRDGVIMGIRHRHLPIFGVQFHPESILTPQGAHLISNFMQLCATQQVGGACD